MTVWLAIKVIDVSKRYKTVRLRDLSTSLIMASCPWLMESKEAFDIFLRSLWLYFLAKSRQSWIYNTCVWRFRISKCKMVRSTYDGKKSFEEPSNNFVTNYYFIFRCSKSRKEVKKCFQITSKLWHKQCDKNIMNISFKCSVRRSEWLGLVLS